MPLTLGFCVDLLRMTVDLKLLQTKIASELQTVSRRKATLNEQLTHLEGLKRFLTENKRPKKRSTSQPEPIKEQPAALRESPPEAEKGPRIRICPQCDIKVLPTREGRCPSCQTSFPET